MNLQQVVDFPLCVPQQLWEEVTLTLTHTSLKSVQTAGFVSGAEWVCSLERFSCSDKLDYCIFLISTRFFGYSFWKFVCISLALSFLWSSSGGATSVPRAKSFLPSRQHIIWLTKSTMEIRGTCYKLLLCVFPDGARQVHGAERIGWNWVYWITFNFLTDFVLLCS